MDGAVERCAVIYFLVENTPVSDHVTKVSAVLARKWSMPVVIVVKLRLRFCAA
jgi:hypothetical protein